MTTADIVIVGAGIAGVMTALELNRRGYKRVMIVDPGPLPHPLAASNDISKAVRIEYGADETYMAFAEQARDGFRAWNHELPVPVYHEVGLTFFTRQPMQAGGFEYESYQLARKRGNAVERLNAAEIQQRFPAWSESFQDGFYDPHGGFVQSGALLSQWLEIAIARGVIVQQGQRVQALVQSGERVTGVQLADGSILSAGEVIVAAGTWTPLLVPELGEALRSFGHPIYHVLPPDAKLFTPPQFGVFSADVSQTGWYGFPTHPLKGVVKVANHGTGVHLHPQDDERVVTDDDVATFRAFLRGTFPTLAEAPIPYTRRCLYGDTRDGHFWIARDPQRAGLTVSAGDSGHGFKFAPLWGVWTADALEGQPVPERFAWRALDDGTKHLEEARYKEKKG